MKETREPRPVAPQFSKCICSRCNTLVFAKWIEYGKKKQCPACRTILILVNDRWVAEGDPQLTLWEV